EREALSKVSRVSAAVLNPVPALAEAARLVKHVTERWDGLGDPDRLSAGGIPYGSRVLAVVDAFDALTTGAGGRKTLPPDVALKELESGAGKLFDPACVESFARLYKSGRFKAALNRPK
ncbi:MAG TPA: HD domain-containing phosphohydrolase, partial [Elusimicrobiota bacterium]|nr:HD domain-containing phosphohydrolase [Elusimicrobiota bacterium]